MFAVLFFKLDDPRSEWPISRPTVQRLNLARGLAEAAVGASAAAVQDQDLPIPVRALGR